MIDAPAKTIRQKINIALTSINITANVNMTYNLNYQHFASLRAAPVLSEVEGREVLFARPS